MGEETNQYSVIAITNYPQGGKKAELVPLGGRRGDAGAFSIYTADGKIGGVELEFGDYYFEFVKV